MKIELTMRQAVRLDAILARFITYLPRDVRSKPEAGAYADATAVRKKIEDEMARLATFEKGEDQ